MKKLITLIPMASALSAMAHPGHGTQNPLSPGHYIANPEHSIPITLAIGTAIVLVTWLANRRSQPGK